MYSIGYLLVVALIIIVVLDIVRSNMSNDKKILWVVLVIIFPVIGAILYYLIGKK